MSTDAFTDLLSDYRATPGEHGRDAGSAPAMLRIKLLKPGGSPVQRERWAFPYTRLQRVELENSSTLIAVFQGATVTIQGPRMEELFDLVSQHKTALIEVINQATRQSGRPLAVSMVDAADVELEDG